MLSSVTRGHWRNTEGEMDFSSKWLLLSLDPCSGFSSTRLLSITFPGPSSSSSRLLQCWHGSSRAQSHPLPLTTFQVALQQSATCLAPPSEWLSRTPRSQAKDLQRDSSLSSASPVPPGWLCREFWDTVPPCAWPPWLPWKLTSSKFHLLGGHLPWSFCLRSLHLLFLYSLKFSLLLTSQFSIMPIYYI